MRVQVQVLALPGADFSAPVLVITVETNRSNKRFLFNFPEGTQRYTTSPQPHPNLAQSSVFSATPSLFGQFKQRLVRIEHVLFTRLDWAHIGGLPGGILTMADAKATRVSLLGPRRLAAFLESTRYFLIRPDVNLEVTEFSGENEEQFVDDETVFVPIVLTRAGDTDYDDPMPLVADADAELEGVFHKDVSAYEQLSSLPTRYRVRLGNADSFKPSATSPETAVYEATETRPQRVRKLLPLRRHFARSEPHTDVLCYAVETPTIPGSFRAADAKALGVKGADFGLLSKGQSVTIVRDGVTTVVTPEMVRSADAPGPVLLLVECPEPAYVASLVAHPAFTRYHAAGARPARIVYHFAPLAVLTSPAYLAWMARFPATTEHVTLCPELAAHPPVFQSSATAQVRLHHVHAKLFPALWSAAAPSPATATAEALAAARVRVARAFEKLTLVPQPGLDLSDVLEPIDADAVVREMLARPDIAAAVSATHKLLAEESDAERPTWPAKPSDPRLAFLGTGAALPSKYRNVTGNYVELPGRGGVLLDCGEGSYGQLLRLYGPDRLAELLLELRVIVISHIHADHHLGTVRILTARHRLACERWGEAEARRRAPILVAPTMLHYWLREYCDYEVLHFRFVDIAECTARQHAHSALFEQELGLAALYTVPVVHCTDAVGVVLEHVPRSDAENAWKLVFSGDTRPCESLMRAGADCTLLIHEATFEDELQSEAVAKNHATTAEAIAAAATMRARFVVLNHFSQRYPKIPIFDESALPDRVGVAFDLMTFTFGDFHRIPKLLPALRALFAEEEDDEAEEDKGKGKDKGKRKDTSVTSGKKRKQESEPRAASSSNDDPKSEVIKKPRVKE